MHTTDLVTGAFGYTGSRIAERLLASGRQVRTITRRSDVDHPLAARIETLNADFSAPKFRAAFEGVETAYVTTWMRFPRGTATWAGMVENIARLGAAAAEAGVRRLVYVSVANARNDSSTPYFRAKAAAEDALRDAAGSATSVAIVRPTLLFGPDDILINNMAWTLRHLPVFGIAGDGNYRVQPVLVDDVADLCIRVAPGTDAADVDAAGPETLTFNELVQTVRGAVRSRALTMHMPLSVVLAATRLIGIGVRDVVLTRDEMRELMESLLVARDPAGTCPTRLSDWITAHSDEVGRRYNSELGRNFRLSR